MVCCTRHTMPPVRYFGQPAARTHPHLVQEGEVTPGITKGEFADRRTRLMEKIACSKYGRAATEHLLIIPSATRMYMAHDIPYTFRQNTDFLYLCGFQEPDSVLLMRTKGTSADHTAVLFVPKRDPAKELWEGMRSGINGAVEITGIDKAFNTEDLHQYLASFARETPNFVLWYDYRKPVHRGFHMKIFQDFIQDSRLELVESPRSLVQSLRVFKSAAEMDLMQRTCTVAAEAFKEVIKFSYPRVNEAHLQAKMEYECKVSGANYLAYPPVVAGGARANTIHYVSNNQLIQDGELVLMDAGCDYHGYSSDITRTWPVSGVYSKVQRRVYEAALRVQEACTALCRAHISIDDIFLQMLILLGTELKDLGIVPKHITGTDLQRAARQFCPHHVSHYLGMDVHDTDEMSRGLPLLPGMVITCEPGLYFPMSAQSVPAEYRGIGVRIEDDILITEHSPVVLTNCPKDPQQIELLMASR